MAAQLGPYAIIQTLGSGGMGAVYRARDVRTGREVALKVMTATERSDIAKRFARESRAALAVRHPNVVSARDAGSASGRDYIAFELVPGGDLRRLLRERRRLPWREAARVVREVAAALDAIHGASLVHRDLKPENVLIAADGRAQLTDFGVARALDGSSLTKTGDVLGTAAYMSPEQADGRRDLDARADLYSLGVILHELLAGEKPFEGHGLALLKAQILSPPRPLPPDVTAPERLRALLGGLLAKNPDARPRDARSVVAALEDIERAAAKKDDSPSRRPLALVVGLGVIGLGVIALGAIAIAVLRHRAERPSAVVPAPPALVPAPPPRPAPPLPTSAAPPPTPGHAPLMRISRLAEQSLDELETDPSAALATAERAVADAPDDPLAHYARAYALLNLVRRSAADELHTAKQMLKAAIDDHLKTQPREVAALLTRYIERGPQDDERTTHLSLRAQAFLILADDEKALADLDELSRLEKPSDHWFTLLREGTCFARVGKLAETIGAMRASRALPTPAGQEGAYGEASRTLAAFARQKLGAGDWRGAAVAYAGAFETSVPPPLDEAQTAFTRAVAALRARGPDAESATQVVDALAPGLASYQIRESHWEDALAALAPLLERQPNSAWALSTQGLTLLRLKRYDEARSALDRAIALADDPLSQASGWTRSELWLAYARRAELFEATGRREEAAHDAAKALEIGDVQPAAAKRLLERLRALAPPK